MTLLVPVAPIKRILEETINDMGLVVDGRGGNFGVANATVGVIVDRIYSYSKTPAANHRERSRDYIQNIVYSIRSGVTYSRSKRIPRHHIDFEWADVILCALDRQDEWLHDPELRAVYDELENPPPPRPYAGDRPLCSCHGEPMFRHGRLGDTQRWRCRFARRADSVAVT